MDYTPFVQLGISLGLGLLVGLQRERSGSRIAGIRTFAIISLLGTAAGWLAVYFENAWIIAGLGLSLALLMAAANVVRNHKVEADNAEIGQTTEIAALLMFGLGAYIVVGSASVAVAAGVILAVVLHLRGTLDDFATNLEQKDVRAILQFAAITLVILPILPNETFGPYDVLNPREVWLMVVLIVGISVIGYFIYKWLGQSIGAVAGGVLGGLISSTATTVTYARRTSDKEEAGRLAAFIITTASAISFVRVIVEVSIVSPQFLGVIAPPLGAVFLFMVLLSLGLYFFKRDEKDEDIPNPDNPAQLKSALVFGALYAIILLAVAIVKDYFGNSGLYAVAIVSGLTDVDAITLSLANTMKGGSLEPTTGWRLILLAALANLVFKGGMAIVLGSRRLAYYVGAAFVATLVVGLLVMWLWPEAWRFGGQASVGGGQ